MQESYLPKSPKVDVKRITHPETGDFDFIVEHRDPKTGQLLGVNKYRTYCLGKETVVYERPVGSGHLYYKNGKPAGQFDYAQYEKCIAEGNAKNAIEQAIKLGVPHMKWEPEVQGDEKLMRQNQALAHRAAELEAELAAIKGEQKAQAEMKKEVAPKAKVTQ